MTTQSYLDSDLVFSQEPDEICRVLLFTQCYIPKKYYVKIFRLQEPVYSFPSLLLDKKGIFTAQSKSQKEFDSFFLITSAQSAFYRGVSPLEKQHSFGLPLGKKECDKIILKTDNIFAKSILEENIKELAIDLVYSKDDNYFVNHRCSVYPKKISSIPEIYDTLYITDYLLKFIYKIFVEMLILNYSTEKIYKQNYVLGFTEASDLKGYYKLSSIYGREGFAKLLNTIKLFILKNKLKTDPKIRESYDIYESTRKTQKTSLKIYVNYNKIKYSYKILKEFTNIHLKPLEVDCNLTYKVNGLYRELPYFALVVKQFMNTHYNDIKKAFGVYKDLENIYRMICVSNIIESYRITGNLDTILVESPVESELEYFEKCVYVGTYPHSIQCAGAFALKAKEYIKVESETKEENYGYGPATDKELFEGLAPYVYHYLPSDSKTCIASKNLYNYTHSSMYSPDTIVRSHPAAPLIQGASLDKTEDMIKQHCKPN
jgi:hypothetical protein